MKKIMYTAAALFVLAGSTAVVTPNAVAQKATTSPKKPTAQPNSIPPAVCAPDDPNGCGIFG